MRPTFTSWIESLIAVTALCNSSGMVLIQNNKTDLDNKLAYTLRYCLYLASLEHNNEIKQAKKLFPCQHFNSFTHWSNDNTVQGCLTPPLRDGDAEATIQVHSAKLNKIRLGEDASPPHILEVDSANKSHPSLYWKTKDK